MAVEPTFGPWTFFQRFIVGRSLHGDDTVPPPHGFSSWLEYYNVVVKGVVDVTTFTSPGGVPRGRKASMVWTRADEDVATIGMHFLRRDGSDVADFTDDDEATINSLLLALWDDLKAEYVDTIGLDRIVWHAFGVGIRRPNPATNTYVQAPAVAGTHVGTDPLPPQCATSVTFKTSVRRQWGRVYLPATVEGVVTDGRFNSGYIEGVRTAFGTMIDGAAAASLPLVVWSPRHGGDLLQFFPVGAGHPESAHSLELDLPDSSSFARTVDQVQVDDVVDVIRSRRFDKALLRETHTIGA